MARDDEDRPQDLIVAGLHGTLGAPAGLLFHDDRAGPGPVDESARLEDPPNIAATQGSVPGHYVAPVAIFTLSAKGPGER